MVRKIVHLRRIFWLFLALPGCGIEPPSSEETAPETAASEALVPLAEAELAAPAPVETPVAKGPCPADMALIEGSYCPAPSEECVAWQESVGPGGKLVKGQCKAFRSPSRCLADHHLSLRYCMDRYEWPNKKGEKPRTLTSWQEAREMCGAIGKRLCSEDEWSFACEGEAMSPYVYGYERDASACNIDKPYRARTFDFYRWEKCLADEACKAAYEAIDQRVGAGDFERCVNAWGVFDLIGNANEWVLRPDKKTPHRSGIKGGRWGPVRSRCGPTVGFHDEADWGYEVGFRCCSDVDSGTPSE